uniref:C2H2-type domain-containing protein n=2 Tax=Ditylenchus dipsaci TaxID=166011 RepID=A0A915DZ34_9BILA
MDFEQSEHNTLRGSPKERRVKISFDQGKHSTKPWKGSKSYGYRYDMLLENAKETEMVICNFEGCRTIFAKTGCGGLRHHLKTHEVAVAISQAAVDEALLKFAVCSGQPMSIVGNTHFISFLQAFGNFWVESKEAGHLKQAKDVLPSANTLSSRLDTALESVKEGILKTVVLEKASQISPEEACDQPPSKRASFFQSNKPTVVEQEFKAYSVIRNLIYVLIGVVSVVLLLLIIILTVVCVQRKKTSTNGAKQRRRSQQQYTQSRKSSKNNQPDLWIQQNGRFAALNAGGISTDFMETPAASDLHDLKRFGSNTGAVESPPSRKPHTYLNVHTRLTESLADPLHSIDTVNRENPCHLGYPRLLPTSPYAHSLAGGNYRQRVVTIHSPKSNTTHKPLREPSNTSIESDQLGKSSSFQGTVGVGGGMLKGGSAKSQNSSPAPKAVNFSPDIEGFIDEEAGALSAVEKLVRRDLESTCHSDGSVSNGTLARSYHQSSTSLEAQRQRTPQVLYTGVNRQPITKVDFASSEHGSYNGGSTTALPHTPPPHPSADPYQSSSQLHDGYQTVRGLNPLKSFAQMGELHLLEWLAIVRPVVFASPTLRNSMAANRPAGIVIGQKSNLAGGHKLPVGRATAQPRVNVSNVVYSPYSTVRVAPDNMDNTTNGHHGDTDNDEKGKFDGPEELKPLRAAASTEEINVHEIDHMIDTLQQLQQEFTER